MVATHQSSIEQADGSSLPESYLTELSEPLQADYRAVISNGVAPSEQADRRNVNTSTVCTNVKRATTKLIQRWREKRATPHSNDESGGYDIELVPVGGRNSDGSPAAISKWTFQTDLVRDRVCEHLSGKVLNACAGRTMLPHSEVVRNDINSEMPNLDSQRDVTSLQDCYRDGEFDTIVLDPPFDSGQADEHYSGWHVSDLTAALDKLAELVAPGGVLIELGWSSHSVSCWQGWEPEQMYLFQRGPTVPDIFLTVDRKVQRTLL